MASADIFDRLKQDHDRHRELLDKIVETSGDSDERRELFDTFKIEVTAHAAAEEESLYATMLAREELRHDAVHSVSEHKEIGDMLEELAEMDMGSSGWLTKFKTLKDEYTHHIDEEEEEMFPTAAEGLSEEKVVELRALFEKRKPKEVARAEAGADEGDDRE
ncbi:hemerythrin domain-containing protein [Sphingomonas sp. LY29]|uniref:hemerythrin domain-containing protein n=1 Tax=unclassified Sphingomonas TaxID=196159 RepID=UPI002ADEA996|nr:MULTISPECIES: hemerythrin domain-containing protein [unclassified Sphingomonas]MEA1072097.1 hemerythrin domain-containing protein [Sphingomonas sp. LY160]WRP25239.1 hemerythrin domain-containing protein [Sphingomonas sp. LY29]